MKMVKKTITENVIVYWSRKFYERDLHENASFLETIEKILKNPKGFRITDLYRFTELDDPDLKLILDAFDIHIPAKLLHKTDLKSQIKNINMDI